MFRKKLSCKQFLAFTQAHAGCGFAIKGLHYSAPLDAHIKPVCNDFNVACLPAAQTS
nr:hypothetical protein [Paracoccus saliphilus]